jgi:hypothetical protein
MKQYLIVHCRLNCVCLSLIPIFCKKINFVLAGTFFLILRGNFYTQSYLSAMNTSSHKILCQHKAYFKDILNINFNALTFGKR